MVVRKRNNEQNQIIDTAMNRKKGKTGLVNAESPQSIDKSMFLLQAAYENSYLSAIKHGRRKLFLTLIGGGMFGNDFKWIHDAIVIFFFC